MDKPTLTVILRPSPNGDIHATGITEDLDVFRNVLFRCVEEALRYLHKRYSHLYLIIVGMPVRRTT